MMVAETGRSSSPASQQSQEEVDALGRKVIQRADFGSQSPERTFEMASPATAWAIQRSRLSWSVGTRKAAVESSTGVPFGSPAFRFATAKSVFRCSAQKP